MTPLYIYNIMSSGDNASTTSTKKQRRFRFFPRRRSVLSRLSGCSRKSDVSGVEESIVGGGDTSSSNPSSLNSINSNNKEDSLTVVSEKGSQLSLKSSSDLSKHAAAQVATCSTSGVGNHGDTNSDNGEPIECPLCLVSQGYENFPKLSGCNHRSCLDCLQQYLAIEITESRINLTCPECQEKLHPNDIKKILVGEQQLIDKWEEFTLRRTLSVDPDCRWCPAPDCGFAVIAQGCASCPKIVCGRPGCNTSFCYHCRQEWHPDQTCDDAHLRRTRQIRVRSNSAAYSQISTFHTDEIKPCPKCGALIVKMNDGSCNHMTCTVCDAEFCWLCLQEITDLHYLSPSGCTFWGKKPWSRKKKILWQLGLMIGAPLGIGLVAGIAVPAIIFGLPFWVARKVLSQFRNREVSKHKRNLAVVCSVTGSALISPALAALVVGVGVPIMLLYVYGIVPCSLCRTGSYGITSRGGANTQGLPGLPMSFRLVDLGGGGDGNGQTTPEDATSLRGPSLHARLGPTNPSIGEASVGGITMGSLNLSRPSDMDKAGRSVDHDASSTVAIAGTSITGSISCISTTGNVRNETKKDELSVNSLQTYTSVQVHLNDNVSVNSVSSFPPLTSQTSKVKKSQSCKSLQSKRSSSKSRRFCEQDDDKEHQPLTYSHLEGDDDDSTDSTENLTESSNCRRDSSTHL